MKPIQGYHLITPCAFAIISGSNTGPSAGGRVPGPETTGLFHVAILYPTRAGLGDASRRLAGWTFPCLPGPIRVTHGA